ncbi:MAG TPA: hypothetical protein VK689_13910, partial [Armatimonadota bacterium]|nr:hypothetical protein [Armatimonadota bacterium]
AGSIHMQHRDQYRLKLFDIELARWMNRVEPLASNLDELSYEGCEHCLKALGKATRRGRKLLHDWDESGLEEAQGGGASGARLRSALAACDELRKGVIARQARTVVATVRPLGDEALPDSPCAALDSRFEVFNARAELGQFTASLRELEAEHARLQARAEVTAHVPGVLS